ncbi:Small-conductance mechanosensitive channel [Synechococcus sp. MIT S9509]|uniref:mechanosensitive ion channel family protein n=1 Tax=unclassified Synechococcus TaxID=2626047 RepID=UPI0007BB85CB|nr:MULTISPECIES: mechanosensitive ion channel family protein [unclassified Synechococcus]KZR86070.1 Small-conductance mechanosensitive channel [Synechococcus sp. MIT S9504]KZR87133.1 Small-conductance mechanosensitive channel [Synechococcus sp. MIT S9509]
MTLTVSLLVIVALLTIHRVCKRQKLSPPPLRLPLIAAIGIPLLNQLAEIVSDAGATLLQNSLEAAITLLWALSLIRILTWGILQIPAELGWWKPTAKILRDLLTLAVITAVVMVVIHREFRVNLVGLAATSAVVTAVIGLAAQETLKNLFAGISLQVDSPFEEGDWIDLGTTTGVVTSLRLMTTRVRGLDGSITVVPNSRIAVEGLRRFKPEEPVGQMIELGLDYSLPPRQAIQLLQRILQHNRRVLRQPTPKVWVSSFADSSITYSLLTWQTTALELRQLRSSVLEQIWYALHRIDQSIPYPVRDVRTKPSQAKLPSSNISTEHKQKLLASTEIFAHLNDHQHEMLAGLASCQTFAPGESVVRQGERGDSLYLVVHGTLEVFQANTNSSTGHPGRHVADLQTSDAFGEMALCTGEARAATVICKSECVLIEIERKHLLPLLEEQPDILETMGSIMAARRQQLNANQQQRAESRRRALIARMKRLFSPSSQEQ